MLDFALYDSLPKTKHRVSSSVKTISASDIYDCVSNLVHKKLEVNVSCIARELGRTPVKISSYLYIMGVDLDKIQGMTAVEMEDKFETKHGKGTYKQPIPEQRADFSRITPALYIELCEQVDNMTQLAALMNRTAESITVHLDKHGISFLKIKAQQQTLSVSNKSHHRNATESKSDAEWILEDALRGQTDNLVVEPEEPQDSQYRSMMPVDIKQPKQLSVEEGMQMLESICSADLNDLPPEVAANILDEILVASTASMNTSNPSIQNPSTLFVNSTTSTTTSKRKEIDSDEIAEIIDSNKRRR